MPGWKIAPHGFLANVPVSDEFVFPSPLPSWKPTATTAFAQTVDLGAEPDGGPTQLKMDLHVPGFSLYFPKGIDLQIGSIGAPFLSWSEGSVEQTVATPASPWILVSFRQGQPPVLFSFPDKPQAMIIDGDPGRWHLRTTGSFSGWVRVLLPFGLDIQSAATASSLGELAQKVKSEQELWSGHAPTLLGTKITSDSNSITETLTFDRAGALVPRAALVADYGGYPVHVTTNISQLETSGEEGPMAVTREPSLSIRFPLHSWPSCRYLASGALSDLPHGSLDIAGASELALAALSADFGGEASTSAGASLMAFLSSVHGELEPNTGVHLPYAASGAGYDLAAAHALLTEALAVSNGTPNLQNPLLDEVQARVDPYSWRPWGMDDATWRRASALAAIACEMRPEPEERLQGCILQAGLSAERGLDLWHYWRGDITKLPPHVEVMENLRHSLFVLQGFQTPDPLVSEVFSPLRFCGTGQMTVSQRNGKWFVGWMSLDGKPDDIVLSGPWGLKVGATENLAKYKLASSDGRYRLHVVPTAAGSCALEVILPAGAASIPARVEHAYVELER